MEEKPLAIDGCFRSPKGKRSKPVFSAAELSAAQSLILLAHSCGGFCPKESTISLPIKSTIFHREKSRKTYSAAAAVTDDVKSKKSVSPDTPLSVYNSVNPQHTVSSCAEENFATSVDAVTSTVNVNNEEPLSAETAPLVLPEKNCARHDCTVCGKSFKSHQALGGHMTMHRSKPKTAAAVEYGGRSNPAAASGVDHECSICHERYPNGQALGGHKRKHFEGIIGNAANSQAKRVAGESSDGAATTPVIIRPKIRFILRPPKSGSDQDNVGSGA